MLDACEVHIKDLCIIFFLQVLSCKKPVHWNYSTSSFFLINILNSLLWQNMFIEATILWYFIYTMNCKIKVYHSSTENGRYWSKYINYSLEKSFLNASTETTMFNQNESRDFLLHNVTHNHKLHEVYDQSTLQAHEHPA